MCAHDLEGIVAKHLADPYDPRVRWLKIKNSSYSQNEGRRDLMHRGGRGSAKSPIAPVLSHEIRAASTNDLWANAAKAHRTLDLVV